MVDSGFGVKSQIIRRNMRLASFVLTVSSGSFVSRSTMVTSSKRSTGSTKSWSWTFFADAGAGVALRVAGIMVSIFGRVVVLGAGAGAAAVAVAF